MDRDILERLQLFSQDDYRIDFIRLALTMEQIEEQDFPENPAKTSDARYQAYADRYGKSSWELDAIRPEFMSNLVEDGVRGFIDWEEWDTAKERETANKEKILALWEGLI
jgi:hypothetical protein